MRGPQGSLCIVLPTAIILAVTRMFVEPAQAQQPTPGQTPPPGYFTFQVCNQSSYKVAMAVVYRQAPNNNNFISWGWWVLEAHNGCVNWPSFIPKGMFYHHEEGWGRPDIYWPADDRRFCVRSQPWQQTWVGGAMPPCRTDERSVGFTAKDVAEDVYTWTMNDR
jgi:Protein of unknown function (DUF1036)